MDNLKGSAVRTFNAAMFNALFMRPLIFLKWLATAEHLPSPASDPVQTRAGRTRHFLVQLFGRENLPELPPVPDQKRHVLSQLFGRETLPELPPAEKRDPDRPSFFRYIFSRDSLPNLSDKGPGETENRQSQTSK